MIYRFLHSKTFERLKRNAGIKSGIYLKLKKFTPSASEALRTATLINTMKVDCVIDVGANTGQFAESLYDFGYKNKVISFEPVGSCYKQLVKRGNKRKNWIVAERCAIGEKDETTTINICEDTVFSSLLAIKDSHARLNTKSKIVDTEEVKVFRLDSVIDKYVDLSKDRILLKIDTQGYEAQVLRGGTELLKKIVGLKIEIPLKPIYENVDFSFYEIIDFVKSHGFYPYSFNIEGVNLKTGRVNTIDGLFFRDA